MKYQTIKQLLKKYWQINIKFKNKEDVDLILGDIEKNTDIVWSEGQRPTRYTPPRKEGYIRINKSCSFSRQYYLTNGTGPTENAYVIENPMIFINTMEIQAKGI